MQLEVALIAGRPVVDEDETVAENRIDREQGPEEEQNARSVNAFLAVYVYQDER